MFYLRAPQLFQSTTEFSELTKNRYGLCMGSYHTHFNAETHLGSKKSISEGNCRVWSWADELIDFPGRVPNKVLLCIIRKRLIIISLNVFVIISERWIIMKSRPTQLRTTYVVFSALYRNGGSWLIYSQTLFLRKEIWDFSVLNILFSEPRANWKVWKNIMKSRDQKPTITSIWTLFQKKSI